MNTVLVHGIFGAKSVRSLVLVYEFKVRYVKFDPVFVLLYYLHILPMTVCTLVYTLVMYPNTYYRYVNYKLLREFFLVSKPSISSLFAHERATTTTKRCKLHQWHLGNLPEAKFKNSRQLFFTGCLSHSSLPG